MGPIQIKVESQGREVQQAKTHHRQQSFTPSCLYSYMPSMGQLCQNDYWIVYISHLPS